MLLAFWARNINHELALHNWGDAINPHLIKLLSKQEVTHVNDYKKNVSKIIPPELDVYYCAGSILDSARSYSVIWGSGLMTPKVPPKEKPKKILAVRGPKTREELIKLGLEVPAIYGDPALLYKYFYNPNVKKEYKIGIIPHYIDHNLPAVERFRKEEGVLIIDIFDPIDKVVDNICKCDVIFSSSLHGLIAADAYNVPSFWIKLSDSVIGEGFKFSDYFLSVNRPDNAPLVVTENTKIIDLENIIEDYKVEINLQNLLEVCPFIHPEVKEELSKHF